jgi:hypothetical protein
MALHTVKVKLPRRVEVLSKDLEVQVRSNGRFVGTLKISKGSLDLEGCRRSVLSCSKLGKVRQNGFGRGAKKAQEVDAED